MLCIRAELPAYSYDALTEEEQERDLHEAAAQVLSTLRDRSIPASTLQALRATLNYWDMWHRAAFDHPLGLLCAPPCPVPAATVLVFIAHHAAITTESHDGSRQVHTGMPESVKARLSALTPALSKRKVAARNRSDARIAHDVPAVKTVLQRVSLLGTLHERIGLPKPQADPRIGRALVTLRKSTARTVPAALPHSKRALRLHEFQGLLDACGIEARDGGRATWIALRDRALLLTGFGSGRRRSEIARMSIEHLQHGTVRLSSGRVCRCIWWHLYALKGRVSNRGDMPLLSLPLVGASRQALQAWLDILQAQGVDRGAVWRTLRRGKTIPKNRSIIGKALNPEAVIEIVQLRAYQAALRIFPELTKLPAEERESRSRAYADSIGAHSLRSGFITSGLDAGMHPLDLSKLTAHTSLDAFRIYDQRKIERNPALELMMRLKIRR